MRPTCPECERLRLDLAEAEARKDHPKARTLLASLLKHECRPFLAAGLWPEKRVIVVAAQESV